MLSKTATVQVEASSLTATACAVLRTANARDKAARSRDAARAWRAGAIREIGNTLPPDRPSRPDRPILAPPRDMPRRRAGGTQAGRTALLHALAHIELNAIDLAWDMVARFGQSADAPPRAFLDDWIAVADDEARHFVMLADRLSELGAAYGDLPAHDGLWEAAEGTHHDLLARLAIVPMVLEARGLDVTPGMIARLRRFGDPDSAELLQTIYDEEIAHVAAGCRWFEWVCARRGLAPAKTWRELVRRHFKGTLKPPFNDVARDAAGLSASYYAGFEGG